MMKRNIGIIIIFSLLISAIFAEAYTITLNINDSIWYDNGSTNTITLLNTSRGVRIGNNESCPSYLRLYIDGDTYLNGTLNQHGYNYLSDNYNQFMANTTFQGIHNYIYGIFDFTSFSKVYLNGHVEFNTIDDIVFNNNVNFSQNTQFNGKTTFNDKVTFNSEIDLNVGSHIYYDGNEVGLNPIGTIIIWSGHTIPPGYHICDGTGANGVSTPDLRGKFIIGNNSYYRLGNTGGVNKTTLSINNLPSHNFTLNGVTGVINGITWGTKKVVTAVTGTTIITDPLTMTRSYYTNNVGSNMAFDNKPPYYALCYLMFVGYT